MAEQLNFFGTGEIIPTALHVEMERSYLEYAMSVIVGRALPDVRDGLKPVHRRILYAMYELGLTPDRPFRKCARVVGDVLGKYHPHGDQAVYDALVRMVQDFSSRYPLLAGHGNFGSVDNDPPAAMRYTETRLAAIAHEAMLNEISEATVNFSSNFDNSQQEPVVLPTQLPNLVLNGCAGIAVGMATNIPPHNLGEVTDGLIALIDKPDLADEKLWEIIPAPDFPTGGEIIDLTGAKEAYATGKGIIPVRGVAKIERIFIGKRRKKEGFAIIVTELPYQVNKAAWIEKVAEMVGQGRLEGIADLRDESDRTGMRVVIEIKKDANPKLVLQELYQHTALQSNFGAIMLALVNNKPCQLPLRELLQEFLNFREQTLTRQYSHELTQAQKRLHLVQGLLAALGNIDAVIDLLKNAPDGTTAKLRLEAEFGMSEVQADSILAMPMRRLTGLERQKLQSEAEDLETRIQELENLLGDRHELMKALKKELRSLKRKFGDPRRTRIINPKPVKTESKTEQTKTETKTKLEIKEAKVETKKQELKQENQATAKQKSKRKQAETELELPLFEVPKPSADAQIIITNQGYIYWQNESTDRKNKNEVIVFQATIGKQEQLVIITDTGKAYPLAIADIPPKSEYQPTTLLSLLPQSAQRDADQVIAYFFLPDNYESLDLVLLSKEARIKRIAVSELSNLTNRGFVLIKLKDQDRLSHVCLTKEGEEMAIATSGGRILRFEVNDQQLPVMGRSAQGNQALRLRYNENLVGCVSLTNKDHLFLVSQLGYGKRLPVSVLRLAHLGDIGTQALQFSSKEDQLVSVILVHPNQQVSLITNQGRVINLATDKMTLWGKDGIGDRLIKLKTEENVIEVIGS